MIISMISQSVIVLIRVLTQKAERVIEALEAEVAASVSVEGTRNNRLELQVKMAIVALGARKDSLDTNKHASSSEKQSLLLLQLIGF